LGRGDSIKITKRLNNRKFFLQLSPVYILLLLILLDAFIAPFLESRRLAISEVFYGILKPVCHQWPTRCLWVFGSNTALCFRCLGIFSALFLTGLFFGIKGANRIYWKTAVMLNIPALVDGYTQLRGWRTSNNFLRLSTGLLSGVGAAIFLFPLYLKAVNRISLIFRKDRPPAT
jgi:uncharacterized membrane protein